ncbi:MAG: signal peptide peptidase SppA [Oligoflexia bacterium]|nr:signal peptide peptidase SppA [Oligoflexia bacterium]
MTQASKRKLNPLALVLILSSAFFVIFLLVSGILFLTRAPSGGAKQGPTAALFRSGTVAVVELNGVIMDSRKMLKKLERLEEDGDVTAVVLRLNSPGGAVAPSQEIYEAVKKFKKPLVASMGSVAASGAYYIACGAKKIYANPGTITGSIGVIMEFANLAKLYEWAKVERYSIKTGKFKDVGATYRAMPPEERALLQGMVDDVLGQFKQAIVDGRKLAPAHVAAIADGRIFSGNQAKSAKLVDELGTLQDAVNGVAKLAGIKGKPEVVYADDLKRRRLLDFLIDDMSKDEDSETSRSGVAEVVSGVLGLPRQGDAWSVGALPQGIYWLWRGSH